MRELDDFRKDFKKKVCEEIDLVSEGLGRLIVRTPFTFDDGDHLKIVLKKDSEDKWLLTDEGHTFMHLSYEDIYLDTKTRQQIIDTSLTTYNIINRDGELILKIDDGLYGDALYSFIQGILHISDVTYLKRERVRSAFMEEFHSFISTQIPEENISFDYHDPEHDPNALYPVDCVIEAKQRRIFLFAILNDDRCRDATIAILQFEKFGINFTAAAIFERQEEINRKVLARFSDVCEKQFSSLQSARERFEKYLSNLERIT
ncbi:MAG: DUF1828 domain-containing protein [Candidatus Thermoplasmatota archaeon]